MNKEDYNKIKKMYSDGYSLRSIESITGVCRKIISKEFKKQGIDIRYRPSEDIEKEIVRLYKDKNTIKNISKKLNIDRHTISKKLIKNNLIEKPCKRLDTSLDIDILSLYSNKESIESISNKLNISTNKVWNCLIENNYTINNYSIYSFNKNIFKKIDTEAKAYWLGFLYADGCVRNDRGLELCLAAKDKEHIEKFKLFMESDKDIKFREKTNSYRIVISSKELAQDLTKLGCFENKSLTLKFPTEERVPKHLIHHFMRGYFDGDGSISVNTLKKQYIFSVLGTDNFLDKYDSYILDILNKEIPNKRQPNGKASSIRYGGRVQILKIYNFLYNDATIYLDRKYEKFNILPSKDKAMKKSLDD